MAHQFAIADIVTLNHTEQEFVVTGWSQDGKLLHVEFLGNHAAGKIYVPPASVTLVRPRGEAPTDHPCKTVGPVGPHKIETTAAARDVTSLWGGGFKTHQRIEDKDMTNQFAIGDTVRLNHSILEAEIIGFKEDSGDPLLHVELPGKQGRMYFPADCVTLVRSGGAAQASHPSKLET